MKKYMSVKEMGDMLGIKKTERYWLDQSTERFDEDRLLTIQQASWVAGTSKQLIKNWYSEGRIPVRKAGSIVRMDMIIWCMKNVLFRV